MVKVYPSILHVKDSGYWIEFPDLEGCRTQGDTIEEVMTMAQEALGLYLVNLVEKNLKIPAPSDIKNIKADGCPTTYITTDIDKYRRDTRAVKKMLSIPAWLAKEAEAKNISLSKVLQDALKSQLHLG
ncbi:type II toxin-antitoxin system HicB family antitoxin [bacterium D16-51]|nr:type II toxin-antitoxin system HicB family antitoxin [bacterium D16-59]RKI54985.1 type II toxin-antitoxin system HicB family antitoxin [bacterium D16-51]